MLFSQELVSDIIATGSQGVRKSSWLDSGLATPTSYIHICLKVKKHLCGERLTIKHILVECQHLPRTWQNFYRARSLNNGVTRGLEWGGGHPGRHKDIWGCTQKCLLIFRRFHKFHMGHPGREARAPRSYATVPEGHLSVLWTSRNHQFR